MSGLLVLVVLLLLVKIECTTASAADEKGDNKNSSTAHKKPPFGGPLAGPHPIHSMYSLYSEIRECAVKGFALPTRVC